MPSRALLIAFDGLEMPDLSGFAQALWLPFDVLLLTGEFDGAPLHKDEMIGAEKIMHARLPEIGPADGLAKAIRPLCEGYSHIAGVSSMQSKDVLARLAGLLGAAMVTDAIGVESPTRFRRPMLAGSVIASVEILQEPVVLTVRTSSFPAMSGKESQEVDVQVSPESRAKVVGRSAKGQSRPDLSQAKVVVSGGRPLKDAATFEKVIGGLADALGGAVGATRAAVDSGIAGNELQVGQTGKVVAPDLYIAAGISGSTQHMAGIKDSKLIVAINKDPDAPIFQFADLGLVADLFDAVPALEARVKQG